MFDGDVIVKNKSQKDSVQAKFLLDTDAELSRDCFCVRFSPDEQYLATSFANGVIRIYDTTSGELEYILNRSDEKDGFLSAPLPTTQLCWRPHTAHSKTKSVLISVNAEHDGQIHHWHVKSGKRLHTITERGNQIFCLDYFCDGSQFVTAGKDRFVRVYDEATKRLVQTLSGGNQQDTAGHSNRVFAVKFHPEHPHVVISGGWDGTVQVWDTRRGHSVRSLWNCHVCGDAVDFSSSGAEILTGSWRAEEPLQLWDFNSGSLVETVGASEPTCLLFAAQLSKDPTSSMILAGGSQENEARFFRRGSQGYAPIAALTRLAKPVYTVDFSPTARSAAVGCSDGKVYLLDMQAVH